MNESSFWVLETPRCTHIHYTQSHMQVHVLSLSLSRGSLAPKARVGWMDGCHAMPSCGSVKRVKPHIHTIYYCFRKGEERVHFSTFFSCGSAGLNRSRRRKNKPNLELLARLLLSFFSTLYNHVSFFMLPIPVWGNLPFSSLSDLYFVYSSLVWKE